MRAACVPLLPLPTQRGQLDTRVFSAKRKIELLVARSLRAGGSWRKSWNDARCCNGGERLAIGTMYPGGIPGPGLIFDACELVVVRRCRGVRCSTCATTCTPSPFVVSLSKWVSRVFRSPRRRVLHAKLAHIPEGRTSTTVRSLSRAACVPALLSRLSPSLSVVLPQLLALAHALSSLLLLRLAWASLP